MVLGFAIRPAMLLAGGATLFALIVLQMLVGFRKIRFKGATHVKVHRWLAWALLAMALVHASAGTIFALGLAIG